MKLLSFTVGTMDGMEPRNAYSESAPSACRLLLLNINNPMSIIGTINKAYFFMNKNNLVLVICGLN